MLKFKNSNETSKHNKSMFRDVNYVDTKHTAQPETLQKFITHFKNIHLGS